ncbi:beta-N-acetylhexosaminidase [Virgibacillus siamensis]|uniref:beta-N-acetylhexosaminidase n=1 Tax=Virgibacillus siamensis TaxID=480071 RepID=UPI000986D59F|nr:beta-N-acetylhexosaminidase [Virgibacillus siamensis]
MDLHLKGILPELNDGLSIICTELGITQSPAGFPVQIEKKAGTIEVSCTNEGGKIRYEKRIHFFRALGLFIQQLNKHNHFQIIEVPQFDTNGIMIDASRNGVMTVEGIKNFLRKMALMGLDVVMMYTEDTFEMKKYPYFGYMRGRYKEDELKECDVYADHLGIEMIPCIQTLAHLTEALKWNYAGKIRDTEDILLVGEKETYQFIEEMIRTVSRSFKSDRIHIGMDEAHRLGLGSYLEKNGYRERFSVMNEHLQQVVSITEKYQLKPMIWSDMYFRLGSKTGGYYDPYSEIPDDVMNSVPENLQLVYWDYYHTDQNFYETFIDKHKVFGSNPIFAGGIWTWNGIAPNYGKTFATTDAALEACKRKGVKEVFATMWADNGAETTPLTGFPGMQLFAEHGYSRQVDRRKLADRFSFCVGGDIDSFLALNEFDETPGVAKDNLKESHPSKFLLWQDVLTGLYDANIKGLSMNEHYSNLAEKLTNAKQDSSRWSVMFSYYSQLAKVLSVKAEFGLKLKCAYEEQDKQSLAELRNQVVPLRDMVDNLRIKQRSLWLTTNKPFGWEVLDIRYGGVIARLNTAKDRLTDYLDGKVDSLEELETERLYHDAPWVMPGGTLGRNTYHRIVTASALSN